MLIKGKPKAARRGGKADPPAAAAGYGSRQLVEWYVDGCRIGSSIRTVPTPGDVVPVSTTGGGFRGRFTVLSVVPSVHPSTGRPPRVAACHLAPLPETPGGQGETPPSPGDTP